MVDEMAYSTYHEIIAWELRAALRRYNDTWEDLLFKEENEQQRFLTTVEHHRVTIVVLSCALLESVINFYLCTKCSAEQFKKLDRHPLLDKWTKDLVEFVPTYVLTKENEIHTDLSQLIERRKAIVHAKPMISIDGDKRHKGNEPPYKFNEHDSVGRWASLPFRLIEHLLKCDPNAFMDLSDIRTCCGAVANEFDGAQRRLEVISKLPRKLITEIMQQGYERRTAVDCAIVIGQKPKADGTGNIVVRRFGKEIARLKPLKFFGSG